LLKLTRSSNSSYRLTATAQQWSQSRPENRV